MVVHELIGQYTNDVDGVFHSRGHLKIPNKSLTRRRSHHCACHPIVKVHIGMNDYFRRGRPTWKFPSKGLVCHETGPCRSGAVDP